MSIESEALALKAIYAVNELWMARDLDDMDPHLTDLILAKHRLEHVIRMLKQRAGNEPTGC